MKWLRKLWPQMIFLSIGIAFVTASPCWALKPNEILVVANRNVPAGLSLSKYYMKKRGIPERNLLKLPAPNKENISGQVYRPE